MESMTSGEGSEEYQRVLDKLSGGCEGRRLYVSYD